MKNLFIFAVGAVTGAAIFWMWMNNKKCEDVICNDTEVTENTKESDESEERNTCETIIRENGYRNYSNISKTAKKTEDKVEKPYVILPDEFGEMDDYETISLIYYEGDKTLTCDDDVVSNVDEIIGTESLNHFGEYEEDSVYVRNDSLKSDYEILLDYGSYKDLLKEKPYLRRGGTNV